MNATLRKTVRISRRKEISSLLRSGQRWECPFFRIVYAKSPLRYDRMAVLVSKRHGGAVTRNRLKRRLREVFRNSKSPGPPFCDVLLVPLRCEDTPMEELLCKYREWQSALGR